MDIQPGPEKQHPYIKKSIPVKFNILHRTLTTCAQRYKTLQETVTFTKREKKSISYSDLEAALEKIEKKKKNSYLAAMESFTFTKNMLLHHRATADHKLNHRKNSICVS